MSGVVGDPVEHLMRYLKVCATLGEDSEDGCAYVRPDLLRQAVELVEQGRVEIARLRAELASERARPLYQPSGPLHEMGQ